jgi:hypothetical protein
MKTGTMRNPTEVPGRPNGTAAARVGAELARSGTTLGPVGPPTPRPRGRREACAAARVSSILALPSHDAL